MRRKRARTASAAFAKPLTLDPIARLRDSGAEYAVTSQAWDLHVWLDQKHTYYHCVVGLTCNLVCWGRNGQRLAKPFAVPKEQWHL